MIKDLFDILCYLLTTRKTKVGLIAVAFLIVLGELRIAAELKPAALTTFAPLTCAVLLTSLVLWLIYWLFDSGRLIWKRKKYLIVFSLLRRDSQTELYFRQTIDLLKTSLRANQLLTDFQFVDAAPGIVDNEAEAKAYAKAKYADMFFFGHLVIEGVNDDASLDAHVQEGKEIKLQPFIFCRTLTNTSLPVTTYHKQFYLEILSSVPT